jgi:hypothetical protein
MAGWPIEVDERVVAIADRRVVVARKANTGSEELYIDLGDGKKRLGASRPARLRALAGPGYAATFQR